MITFSPRSACGKAGRGGGKMRWDEIPRFTSCRNYGVEWSLFRYFCEYIDHETEAGLVLNPDFQRGHVWTEEQQTAYIEYLLMGGLSGRTVYLNAKDIGSPSLKAQDYVCVDGLQRITAIQRFYRDEIPAFGHRYSQFEGKLNSIKLTIRVVLNDLQTREEVLQWYLELNTTGVPHSKEELDRVKALLNRERENGRARRNAPLTGGGRTLISPASRPVKKRKSPER